MYSVAIASDSGQVVAGRTNSLGGGGYDALIMKMNKRGNVIWSKVLGGSNDDDFTDIKLTSDGYIACGTTRSYGNAAGEAWLVKLDGSGSIQWSKKYGDGSVEGGLGSKVIQLSDGGYALCGIYKWAGGSGGVAQSFVVRTDGQGNVIWSKQYTLSAVSDDASAILEDGNSLVVIGYYNGASFMDSYIMKLDKANGTVQWVKGYDAEGRSTTFSKIAKTNTGYQVIASIADNFVSQNEQSSVWNINTDGTLQNVRKLVIPGTQTISFGWYALSDGGFVISNGENNNNSDVLLSKVNASGSIAWSKKYQRTGRQQIYSIQASNEGGYVLAGNNNNPGTAADSTNVYLIKVDSAGNAGTCSGINTTDVTILTPSFVTSTLTAPSVSDVAILNPVITVNPTNFDPVINTLCFYCYIKPTGTQRIAASEITQHTLKVYPNPTSSDPINVLIDAKYDDEATISVVDIYGNILYVLPARQIRTGQNLFQVNVTNKLKNYSNYFIVVKYRNFKDAIKIFFVK